MDKIKELQARLKSGEDFAALARSSSNDPGSAPIGGDLGYIQRGEMIQSFEDSAFSLKPGQISGIVETRFGYHLIQLLDKEDRTVHVRHILAAFDRSRTDPARTLEQLRSIRADILSGKATFADMAKKYSDDQASARIGGLLQSGGTGKSVFAPDALRPELRTIIATLKNAGDISQPTRLAPPKGGEPFFAIFKLVDRIPAHRMNPEKDYAALEELALDAKKQQIYTAWIQSLKKEVLVKILSDI
jgi:peptidyl-prolyl cis-trans isomerase SurA